MTSAKRVSRLILAAKDLCNKCLIKRKVEPTVGLLAYAPDDFNAHCLASPVEVRGELEGTG